MSSSTLRIKTSELSIAELDPVWAEQNLAVTALYVEPAMVVDVSKEAGT